MRRSDREVTDVNRINEIIAACEVCRIGLVDDGNVYIVPLNFGYDGEALYFHGASVGKKLDLIRQNGKAGFEMDTNGELVTDDAACDHSYLYASVIGSGAIEVLEDLDAKRAGLQIIMKQLTGKDGWEMPDSVIGRTAVIKLTIDKMTCKEHK